MRIFKIIFLWIISSATLQAQNTIADDSPIVGTWSLISPKNSPGPEFIAETYKGINGFTINAGKNESTAEGNGESYNHSLSFKAEWGGKKLTGQVTQASWNKEVGKLKVSVPFEYDSKKKQIIIHVNNAEYGDVKFIYQKMKW
jgi:hypothetical protein